MNSKQYVLMVLDWLEWTWQPAKRLKWLILENQIEQETIDQIAEIFVKLVYEIKYKSSSYKPVYEIHDTDEKLAQLENIVSNL